VVLQGEAARDYLRWPEYHEVDGGPERVDGVALNPAALEPRRHESLAWLANLLRLTAERPPQFACFGLHEWAMVYRQTPAEVRHNAWPLRFPPEELARIVEAQPVRCSHYDAFRFFTEPARPLNRLQPTRAETPLFEQRGCLHANMDLYKWAFKFAPFSPYDLARLGFAPVRIETAEGRTDYERYQRDFAERSQPLRARLLAVAERLLTS
jgi:hypothetical protein